MFNNIIVVTNLEPNGDRALPVAAALGSLARIDVELVKVAPRSLSTAVDSCELSKRAVEHGWPANAARVIQADEYATAIAGEVNARPDALLIMATSAKHPLIGHVLGSVSEAVLQLVDRPVLLVGPHVPAELHWTRPTLVACVHPNVTTEELVAAVASWTHTFPASPPRIVEVVPEAGFGACPPPPLTRPTSTVSSTCWPPRVCTPAGGRSTEASPRSAWRRPPIGCCNPCSSSPALAGPAPTTAVAPPDVSFIVRPLRSWSCRHGPRHRLAPSRLDPPGPRPLPRRDRRIGRAPTCRSRVGGAGAPRSLGASQPSAAPVRRRDGLACQPQHAFSDDRTLDLVRTAGDRR